MAFARLLHAPALTMVLAGRDNLHYVHHQSAFEGPLETGVQRQ